MIYKPILLQISLHGLREREWFLFGQQRMKFSFGTIRNLNWQHIIFIHLQRELWLKLILTTRLNTVPEIPFLTLHQIVYGWQKGLGALVFQEADCYEFH